ncbi:hypothetical protein LCGC14_0591210 [marine sediment metagenome]|uniref:Uncharacterized protein n=1 Tax=marine sediment metagenome TaxID=412755 RepID=A0A0F9RIB9_9ZZZZ
MKEYSLSLTISHTEEELDEAGLSGLSEKEIQEHLEDEFNELIGCGTLYDTEFKVKEL